MSMGFLVVEDIFQRAAKEILPPNVQFLDTDGRLFHLMPSSDGVHYWDVFAAWIVERKYPAKKHFGSQIILTGGDIWERKPTLEWAKSKIAEALSRMVEFEDGGSLPNNGFSYAQFV